MSNTIVLKKMDSVYADPIQYKIGSINLTEKVGAPIEIIYQNKITCKECGKSIKKTFFDGFCYPCFQSSPSASECILKPELCRGHLGEGRNPDWEIDNHVQDHTVYLAVSSGLKVGVTRSTQVPTRWIDQGASYAIPLAKVPNRFSAGLLEVELKQYVSDKTAWQRMLKNEITQTNLLEEKNKLSHFFPEDYTTYLDSNNEITSLTYPVISYPDKVKSLSLDKTPEIKGKLTGIKGQYIYIDYVNVLNIRKFTGYHVSISFQ